MVEKLLSTEYGNNIMNIRQYFDAYGDRLIKRLITYFVLAIGIVSLLSGVISDRAVVKVKM